MKSEYTGRWDFYVTESVLFGEHGILRKFWRFLKGRPIHIRRDNILVILFIGIIILYARITVLSILLITVVFLFVDSVAMLLMYWWEKKEGNIKPK